MLLIPLDIGKKPQTRQQSCLDQLDLADYDDEHPSKSANSKDVIEDWMLRCVQKCKYPCYLPSVLLLVYNAYCLCSCFDAHKK